MPVLLLPRKNRICLNGAARSWTVLSLCSREVREFFVSLHGNFTLKTPLPISVALLSAILPTTQEKVDELLGVDHGIKDPI